MYTPNDPLVQDEEGYQFAHLSLQEYLAAVEIARMQREDLLLAQWENEAWAETIRLYTALGKTDATGLLQAALARPTVASLSLAADCFLEQKNSRVDPGVRQQLNNVLERALGNEDPALAERAARVKLRRRLAGDLFVLEEGRGVARSALSLAEYALFKEGKETAIGRGSRALEPVAVPFTYAIAFCGWLTANAEEFLGSEDIGKSKIYFRLATPAELRESGYEDLDGVWSDRQPENSSDIEKRQVVIVQDCLETVPEQYQALQLYLARGEWKAADEETLNVMCRVSDRESQGYLDEEAIKKFPCPDLRIIDQLWVQFSGGRFGFSVQKRIWMACGGKPGTWDYKAFERYGDRVQWYVENRWFGTLRWSIYDTPTAHLPYHTNNKAVNGLQYLAQRLVNCSIP